GAGLAFTCDLKVAAEGVKFHPAFVKVGLTPDSGLLWWLVRAAGPGRALEHAWTGEPIEAAHALQTGLLNRVVPADKVLAEAQALAAKIAAMPPKAVALTKRSVQYALENA